jgi:hypothetical protein
MVLPCLFFFFVKTHQLPIGSRPSGMSSVSSQVPIFFSLVSSSSITVPHCSSSTLFRASSAVVT